VKPLILLDFDGVLFNSAYEAYQVCERMIKGNSRYRQGTTFDEFMSFRSQLTDAWQFCRLYHKERILRDINDLHLIVPDQEDWVFTGLFFAARAEMMTDPNWAKLMSPYPFFYQLRPLLLQHPERFKILSTRNKESISRTMAFFEIDKIEIYGQEEIRKHGSKLNVAKNNRWLNNGDYVVYIDDMNSHLEPFEAEVNLCLHAGWGYDAAQVDSYTQSQVLHIVESLLWVGQENPNEPLT
jgi:hypothetical protein